MVLYFNTKGTNILLTVSLSLFCFKESYDKKNKLCEVDCCDYREGLNTSGLLKSISLDAPEILTTKAGRKPLGL